MRAEITAIVTTVGALLVAVTGAAWTYWLTKKKEREAEIRKEKLEHYKAFVASLNGILEGEDSPEGQEAFALACNRLLLFAPQPVLEALRKYQEESRASNTVRDKKYHDKLLSSLLFEIRRDLTVTPKDKRETFAVWLWASGVKPDHSETDWRS